MPFVPLVFTSMCFFIPGAIGFVKRRRCRDIVATCLLGCTSVWFHGTRSTVSYIIDKTYAHCFAVSYMTKSILRCIQLHRACDFVILAFSCGSLIFYYHEGDNMCVKLHSLVHTCSIIAFSLYMITSDERHKRLIA